MAVAKRTWKRILVQGLGPEAVSTLIGVIIGIVTYREETVAVHTLTEHLVVWILNINAGAVAHQLAWLLVIKSTRLKTWDQTNTFKAIWKPTALGVLLTFVFVFLINKGYELPGEVVVMMFAQVVAICVLVHTFLFQFGFYRISRKWHADENPESENESETAEPPDQEKYLSITVNEQIEKVNLEQVSHIKVEDHYCTVVYRKENRWLQWTVYGKLKKYEKEFPTRLVRLNRSVLANPDMVSKVAKANSKHVITLKGEPDTPYTLSSNQKHLLDRLIPVVK